MHLAGVLRRAADHPGTAVVEVLQNCRVFNADAWAAATDRELRPDGVVLLEHNQPARFGRDGSRGLRLAGLSLKPGPAGTADLLHDEAADPALAQLLARGGDGLPVALGVIRAAPRPPAAAPPVTVPGAAAALLTRYRAGAS